SISTCRSAPNVRSTSARTGEGGGVAAAAGAGAGALPTRSPRTVTKGRVRRGPAGLLVGGGSGAGLLAAPERTRMPRLRCPPAPVARAANISRRSSVDRVVHRLAEQVDRARVQPAGPGLRQAHRRAGLLQVLLAEVIQLHQLALLVGERRHRLAHALRE